MIEFMAQWSDSTVERISVNWQAGLQKVIQTNPWIVNSIKQKRTTDLK